MTELTGKSVYQGVAMGPLLVIKRELPKVEKKEIEDPETEINRVDQALTQAKEQLQKLYEKTKRMIGEDSAAIFEVHQMMVEDEDYIDSITT